MTGVQTCALPISLYNFYGKRGFEAAFYAGHTIVTRDQIPEYNGSFAVSESTAEEFMGIRENAFSGRTMFVRWDGDALSYRLTDTAFNGGETLTLTTGGARAVAVCYSRSGSVLVKELALDGMTIETALAILQRKYDAQEYHLRLPMDIECPYPLERVASGAAYWYDTDAKARTFSTDGRAPYISLVLD